MFRNMSNLVRVLIFAGIINVTIGQTWTNISDPGTSITERAQFDAETHPGVHPKGLAFTVSGRGAELLAVSSYNDFLYFSNDTKKWEVDDSAGGMASVCSCRDGTNWILKPANSGDVFRQDGGHGGGEAVLNPPEPMLQISAQDFNHSVVLAESGAVYKFKKAPSEDAFAEWLKVPSKIKATQVSMDNNGKIYIVDADGKINVLKDGADWAELPVSVKVKTLDAYDDSRIVVSSTAGEVFLGGASGKWDKKSTPKGGCMQISLSRTELFCVTPDQDIFKATA